MDARLHDPGEVDAALVQLAFQLAIGAVRKFGGVPAELAPVLAPRLPVEVEREVVDRDVFRTIGVDELQQLVLVDAPLAVGEAHRPLRKQRRWAAESRQCGEQLMWLTDDDVEIHRRLCWSRVRRLCLRFDDETRKARIRLRLSVRKRFAKIHVAVAAHQHAIARGTPYERCAGMTLFASLGSLVALAQQAGCGRLGGIETVDAIHGIAHGMHEGDPVIAQSA